jgi:hypothetical protein
MSADAFDDWCWAKAFFTEWASMNVPCGNRETVAALWQEMSRGMMWNVLCKEEAAMYGKEISFTVDHEPDDDWIKAADEEIERAIANDTGFLDAISQPDDLNEFGQFLPDDEEGGVAPTS